MGESPGLGENNSTDRKLLAGAAVVLLALTVACAAIPGLDNIVGWTMAAVIGAGLAFGGIKVLWQLWLIDWELRRPLSPSEQALVAELSRPSHQRSVRDPHDPEDPT